MGNCIPVENVVGSLEGECDPLEIGCVPLTTGEPTFTPNLDGLPFAYDPATGCIWLYQCDEGPWVQHCPDSGCPCMDPVIIEGSSGIMANNKCYQISDALNTGDRSVDSRTSILDGVPLGPMPLDWSFTNTTNQEGVLRVHATMWTNRTQPGDGSVPADIPAQTLFMLGLKSRVDLYPLDPDSITTQANGPHNDGEVSYEIHELPIDPRYGWWGQWRGTTCNEGVECNVDREVATDISHEFTVDAGETIDISAFIAVGYQRAIAGGEIETGWFGADIRFIFVGHNEI